MGYAHFRTNANTRTKLVQRVFGFRQKKTPLLTVRILTEEGQVADDRIYISFEIKTDWWLRLKVMRRWVLAQ